VAIAFLHLDLTCSSTTAWRGNAETRWAAPHVAAFVAKILTNRSEAPLDDLGESEPSDSIHVAVDTHNTFTTSREPTWRCNTANCVSAQARAASYPFVNRAVDADRSCYHAFRVVGDTPAR